MATDLSTIVVGNLWRASHLQLLTMAYREFEKAALQKLAQIDASGPYHERQIYLANRGWEKNGKSDKTIKEEVTAAPLHCCTLLGWWV